MTLLELKKKNSFLLQDVSLYPQTLQVWDTKTFLPFLQKGEKASELAFFFFYNSHKTLLFNF
ncbi:hypothetical protein CMU89_07310 [Elizabethkingia anophelis]|nr:hypothetical protein [Elizabethkingia anophelis]MDV3542463.1 hypothetical protein [Elizabethkingia anophelis]